MKTWLNRAARLVLGIVTVESKEHHEIYVRWLHDRRGYPLCISCRCAICGTRRSLLFPVRRMAMHLERSHK